ncbi:MAG: PAS domain S-box protein, partial [Ignavibacteriales bacterium]|nr:PAS domain S-box protein [Ignavibacteriales bacterium]
LDNYFQGKSDHVASTVYTMADGLKSNEFSGAVYPSAWKSSNGKLWFGTYQGLAVVDPGKIKDNALPPSVFIEQVFIDKRSINISDNVQLPAGVGELEFHYAGLSFLVPGKVKFKYKLEGFNQTWVDAGTRRVAYYTNIPPASYRFRVIACNNDGLWNEAGTSFEFSLAPHFYKTRWFYGLCVLAVILAGASVHRFRVAKLKTRERELTHRVNERTEEIHKLNGELEDRVMERTAELRDVNAELQKDIAERKRAEEALRQSEERFRTIYESSPIGIASIGISGKFIQVNSAFEKLIGYSEAELRSMSFISITYPDDVGESTEVFKQLVENRRDRAEFEKRYIQKNGQVIWTHLTLSVARDAHGNLLHTVTMIEDITERKHAEEEVRKQLAELQRWHVLTLDREDRVQALKQEINELLIRLSEPIRYPSQARASRDTELKQRG